MNGNFLVVYRMDRCFFAARNPDELKGVTPEEIWFFGEAFEAGDKEIEVAARAASNVHGVRWHEIPQ